ncbi:MAG: hypothetical protein ACJAVK_000970 [Akkermansiaceae bacterium]|jgi:hypothetical protein
MTSCLLTERCPPFYKLGVLGTIRGAKGTERRTSVRGIVILHESILKGCREMQTSPVFRECGRAVLDASSPGFSSVFSGHSSFPSRPPQTEVWGSAPLSLQDPASRPKSSKKMIKIEPSPVELDLCIDTVIARGRYVLPDQPEREPEELRIWLQSELKSPICRVHRERSPARNL